MFEASTYMQRRRTLQQQFKSGLLFFLGNEESPMNYPANTFPFRQDSSFLYYWGLDVPGLAAIMDIDEDREMIFGNDLTVADIVWTGPQPSVTEKSEKTGVHMTAPLNELEVTIRKAVQQGRKVHFLPPYRAENVLKLERLMGIHSMAVADHASRQMTKAVVLQRSKKAKEEIDEIESAIDITHAMQTMAMKLSKPGTYEREVAGAMEGLAISMGGEIAFPIIFSIHGETLHNHYHGNVMKAGNIVVNDSGAASAMHYAGDITRTFPVSGRFTERQKDIYRIVLHAQEKALQAIKLGIRFKDVHSAACRTLAGGLKELGLMKGDMEEAVKEGAHALFFQCGLGHMMGLDVHDMEDLGEEFIGYDDEVHRSEQFGLCYLRLAKALQPGFVLTVEPGIYFIPELIDAWKAEKRFNQFINYELVEQYKDFGGIRVEDDILVVEDGYRILGKRIPKTIDEVEEMSSRH